MSKLHAEVKNTYLEAIFLRILPYMQEVQGSELGEILS